MDGFEGSRAHRTTFHTDERIKASLEKGQEEGKGNRDGNKEKTKRDAGDVVEEEEPGGYGRGVEEAASHRNQGWTGPKKGGRK